jgi:hypothetical protein
MAELILTGPSTTVDLTPFSFERILSGRMIEGPNEYKTRELTLLGGWSGRHAAA